MNLEAWQHRKEFVGFGPRDEAILHELRSVALHYADEVMDELYVRWLQFPELRRFFPDDSVLARVKALQRQYFISLTGGGTAQSIWLPVCESVQCTSVSD